jgi:hypothetical protein
MPTWSIRLIVMCSMVRNPGSSHGARRSLYPDWEGLARSVVSYIRMEAARKPDDPRLAELVGDLSIRNRHVSLAGAPRHAVSNQSGGSIKAL